MKEKIKKTVKKPAIKKEKAAPAPKVNKEFVYELKLDDVAIAGILEILTLQSKAISRVIISQVILSLAFVVSTIFQFYCL